LDVTDFLDVKRKEINDRLRELKPLVEEYHRLEAAANALAGVGANGQGAAPRARGRRAGGGGAPRGRRRGGATRANQALELVRSRPGITIPELAAEMGIKQNYLYRVLPGLAAEGSVRKQGRGWHPAQAA
jgi:hypothetical protein